MPIHVIPSDTAIVSTITLDYTLCEVITERLDLPAILESGNIFLTRGPTWSATATGMLCSTMKSTNNTSALMTDVSRSLVKKPVIGFDPSTEDLYERCFDVLI